MAEERFTAKVQSLSGESQKGILLCISGPSGVGKGTIIQSLREIWPGLRTSISVTTRKPRPQEVEGEHYYFRTREEFEAMLRNDEILEYDCYTDNYYGTPRRPIEEILEHGDDCVMDITVAGTLAIKEKFPDAVSVFLLPPSLNELEARLSGRGTEKADVIRSRLDRAMEEIKIAPSFDYILLNNRLEQSLEEIKHIVIAEKLRAFRRQGIEQKALKR